MPRSIDYHQRLIESLKDPKEAQAYLNTALEEGDPQLFFTALRNVAQARGRRGKGRGKQSVQDLFRNLSEKENMSIQKIEELLSRLGFRLSVELDDAA